MAGGGQRDIEEQAYFGRTAQSEGWQYTKRELTFTASEEYTNAATGETANLYIENPAGSGTSLIVTQTIGNPQAQSYVRIYDGFTDDPSGGTAVDVENHLLDSGGEGTFDPGVASVQRDVTITTDNTFLSGIVGGSSAGENSESGSLNARPFIVEPGRRILIEVEKLVSDGDNVTITADWFEREVVFTNESPTFNDMTF